MERPICGACVKDEELQQEETEDSHAAQRAARITPRTRELEEIIARNPTPSSWYDEDEPLF
jgi:hypothetical protein